MVFAHCCVGAPSRSEPWRPAMRQELGVEVCHEDDDARELGDFRQTAKLVEKSEAPGPGLCRVCKLFWSENLDVLVLISYLPEYVCVCVYIYTYIYIYTVYTYIFLHVIMYLYYIICMSPYWYSMIFVSTALWDFQIGLFPVDSADQDAPGVCEGKLVLSSPEDPRYKEAGKGSAMGLSPGQDGVKPKIPCFSLQEWELGPTSMNFWTSGHGTAWDVLFEWFLYVLDPYPKCVQCHLNFV